MKKKLSTRNLKIDSLIRIYKEGYGYIRLTIVDNNDYFLSGIGDDIQMLNSEDHVRAYFWDDTRGTFEATLVIAGTISSPLPIVLFNHTDTINYSTERKCLTASVNIAIQFISFAIPHTDNSIDEIPAFQHEGTIVRLSDREAVILSPIDLLTGSMIKGHFILGKTTIDFIGKILLHDEENGRIRYTIPFTGMNQRTKQDILDFVFSTYRE